MNQLLVCSACSSSGSSDSHSKDCSAHSKISIPVIQVRKHISTMTIFKLIVGPNSPLNPGKAFFSWILSKRTCLWPLCQIADIKQLLDEYLSTYYLYFEKFNGSCEWRIYRLFDLAQLSWYWLFDFLYYISIYPNETSLRKSHQLNELLLKWKVKILNFVNSGANWPCPKWAVR